MRVPSHQVPSNPASGPRTVPVDKLFGPEKHEEGTFGDKISDIYFTPASQQDSMATTLSANKKRYKQLLEQAVEEGRLDSKDLAAKQKLFDSGKLGPHGDPSQDKALRALENEQFLLLHHPQQCADGLYRNVDYYVSPGSLSLGTISRGWDTAGEIPIADTVVIGAGPGGLSTAWQLARRGSRVVCFESELAGAAFSDAGAKAVHSLRTSADGTNLVQDGHALATLEHPLSLHGNVPQIRRLASQGRQAEAQLTGMPSHGVAPESQHPEDRNSPAARGEFFEHMSRMAHSLATDFEDGFLCERSPVNGVTYDEKEKLFTVSTSRGHKMKSRNLVLSTGLTGPQGQRGRRLPQLSTLAEENPDKVLTLGRTEDLSSKSEELASSDKALIVQERLLGQQAVRQQITSLPEGSRVAVVGSGESAVKAALELAHLNPGIVVDLFAKETMEAAQTQIPNENFHTAVLENTLQDPMAVEAAWERTELFGTPVTPRSLLEIFELQKAGRVNLLELGHYFDEHTVDVKAEDDGTMRVDLNNGVVEQKLAQDHQKLLKDDLVDSKSKPFTGANYSVLVEAVGYKPQKLQDHPLRHLPPEAHQKMHLNTAGSPNHPGETSLAGLSVRARQLADQLAEEIPEQRRVDLTVPQERGIDWREVDAETVQGIIDNRGLHPGFARAVRRDIEEFGDHPQAIRLKLPSTDTKLRELHFKNQQGTITAAEERVLERGMSLTERMERGPRNDSPTP